MTPTTSSLNPSQGTRTARLGLLLTLIIAAILFTAALVTHVMPAGTSAPMISVPAMVEPLRADLRALAASVVPDSPDLNPSTTTSLRRAVQLVIKPAAYGDFTSALTNLDQLDSALTSATSGATGTHVSYNRATIIRTSITVVRADLTALQQPAPVG